MELKTYLSIFLINIKYQVTYLSYFIKETKVVRFELFFCFGECKYILCQKIWKSDICVG